MRQLEDAFQEETKQNQLNLYDSEPFELGDENLDSGSKRSIERAPAEETKQKPVLPKRHFERKSQNTQHTRMEQLDKYKNDQLSLEEQDEELDYGDEPVPDKGPEVL